MSALVVSACGAASQDGDQPAERDDPPAVASDSQGERADQPEAEADARRSLPRPDRQFVTRPDIKPPVIDITTSGSTAPGLLFFGPKNQRVDPAALIIDDEGEVVYAHPDDQGVTSFQVQRYRGEPVLTWWHGRRFDGRGDGQYVVMNSSYEEVARFAPGNDLPGDHHELQLTDEGTALILIYHTEPADLTPYGGPADGYIYENYVQEVDIETGEVLLQWKASDHISVSETFSTLPGTDGDGSRKTPFDWFHVNSVAEDGDDTLLVSARNTNGVYAIDRRSGEVQWRLGGRQNDFEMVDDAAEFFVQHDARRQPDGTISILDNAQPGTPSRALFLDVDEAARTAATVSEVLHPDGLRAVTQGNAQLLPTGGVVIGWGSEGGMSEFSPDGELVFDASFTPGDSYRSYRFEWEGHPTDPPDVAVRPGGNAGLDVYVSWNGATEVTEWRVLAGDNPGNLRPVTTVAKDGFETEIAIDAAAYVAVEALDASGEVLGTYEAQTTS